MYSHAIHTCLSERFDVDVVVLKKHRIFQNFRLHEVISLLRGVFTHIPLNVVFHSTGIRDHNLALADYKYIVVDHIESLGAIEGTETPYVLIAHNLEYKLARDKLPNKFAQSLFQLAKRLRDYEYRGFAAAKGVICISASEAAEISNFSDNVIQLLPSFPNRKIDKVKSERIRFGFIGPATWPPNARTVQKLVSNILPNVNRDFEFVLAGSGWEKLTHPKTTRVLGFVDDTKEFWENVDFLLAPTEQGAGVNVKICEALHYGVSVITNAKSADAIFGDAPLPDSVIIADTDEDLLELLNKIELSNANGGHGGYSQRYMGEKLAEFWENLDG